MTHARSIPVIVVVLLALIVRLWMLDWKPPHFDEGVNGAFVDAIRGDPAYRYNPENFHGPLHFYAMFASEQIFGRGVWALRLPTAIIGAATVVLMFAFRRFFSAWVVWVAAIACAISPAMIFYSRYAIHEAWLPFFSMLAIYGAFGIARGERRMGDLWAVGAGLAGMVLTKETYILHFVAAFLAWLFVRGRSGEQAGAQSMFTRTEIMRVAAVCGAVLLALYSGLFYYWPGVAGILKTFGAMAAKGWSPSEEGHHKELLYFVKLLGRYEWPALAGLAVAPVLALRRSVTIGLSSVVLGLILAIAGWLFTAALPPSERPIQAVGPVLQIAGIPWNAAFSAGVCFVFAGVCAVFASPVKCRLMCFLALYALASVSAYSLVSYKTPWCVMTFLPPLFLVLGHCFERLVRYSHWTVVVLLGFALGAAPAMDSWRINFVNPTSPREPYIYVQQLRDFVKLTGPVERLIERDPSARKMTGVIIYESPQPLPWALPDLPNVAVVSHRSQFDIIDADFLLVHESRVEEVESLLLDIYYRSRFRFFSVDDNHRLYLRASVFSSVMESGRVPEFHRRVRLEVGEP